MSDLIKMMALDEADLTVMSALMQDAVLKTSALEFNATEKRLVLPLNRYAWEVPGARRWLFPKKERRLAVLHFDRVLGLRSVGIDRSSSDQVLSLLSVQFELGDDANSPEGTLHFTFAGGAEMIATVECIEAKLTDQGAAWSAGKRPHHAGQD